MGLFWKEKTPSSNQRNTVIVLLLQEMFEKVNKAYEFLCSSKKTIDGPDPRNIVLILKAQCILFSRHREGKLRY